MAEVIVLVRHGKAEPRSMLVSDQKRKLTSQGRDLLEQSYPQAFAELSNAASRITVLASPAARALQTAEFVCKALKVSPESIVTLKELYDQNEEAIIGELRKREGIVVAVGHSPSIDEVASRLTGRMRSMLRGEALCLDATGSPTRMPVVFDCTP